MVAAALGIPRFARDDHRERRSGDETVVVLINRKPKIAEPARIFSGERDDSRVDAEKRRLRVVIVKTQNKVDLDG